MTLALLYAGRVEVGSTPKGTSQGQGLQVAVPHPLKKDASASLLPSIAVKWS